MLVITARDLLPLSVRQIEEKLGDQSFRLVFDDGEIDTDARKTIYSSFCWTFHRKYPHVPLLTAHHLGKRRVTSTSHVDILSNAYWDCFDGFEAAGMSYEDSLRELEVMDKMAYVATNALYIYAVMELPEYVETLCLDDYAQILNSPAVAAALDSVVDSRESLAKTREIIRHSMMNSDDLAKNPLASFVRSDFITSSQTLKCIAPLGPNTEIDSTFFRFAIMGSYIRGVRSLPEAAAESRGAAKALYYSKDHVEKGEYFNRKMQLGCSVIERLIPGDCGTDRYLEVDMTSERLDSFEGKYRVLDTMKDGKPELVPIWKSDRHLIGKRILVRSSIHCNHLGKAGICHTCFGYMANSIPLDSNLGHVCSSVLCHDASQSILSVKHDDKTADSTMVVIGDIEKDYLEISDEDDSALRLIKPMTGSGHKLVVEARYLRNLKDVSVPGDITRLSIPNTSSIHDAELWFVDEEGFDRVVSLTIANGERMASFTHDALEYIRKHEWSISADGRYVFDLSEWLYELPMFTLPVKHANMIEFIKDIETYARSSGKREDTEHRDRLINHDSLDKGLLKFHELVASKLKVNIVHLEIVVASTTARSQTDLRLPDRASDGVVVSYEELIRGRSLALALAYEHLERIYGNPETYNVEHRQAHCMDDIMF